MYLGRNKISLAVKRLMMVGLRSGILLIVLHTVFWIYFYPLVIYGVESNAIQDGIGIWLMISPSLLLSWITVMILLFIGSFLNIKKRMSQTAIAIFCVGILAINECAVFSLTTVSYSSFEFWMMYIVKIGVWICGFLLLLHIADLFGRFFDLNSDN